MGHWEDFWWETHKELESLGLQKKFEEQLEKMRSQDKHQFKDSRERWSYALSKVIEVHRRTKTKV